MLLRKASMGIGFFIMAVFHQPLWAEARIAYSKSSDIEVFGGSQAWCQSQASLRLQGGSASNTSQQGIQAFMTKVGRVLIKECPQASGIDLQIFKRGVLAATAITSPSSNWQVTQWQSFSTSAPASTQSRPASSAENNTGGCDADCMLQQLIDLQGQPAPEVSNTKTQPEAPTAEPPVPTPVTVAAKSVPAVQTAILGVELSEAAQVTASEPSVDVVMPRGKGVYEGLVKTADKQCGFYLNTVRNQSQADSLVVKVSGIDCYHGKLHGKGLAQVFDGRGNNKGNFNGYFSYGYFTGSTQAPSAFAARGSKFFIPYQSKSDWISYPVIVESDGFEQYLMTYTANGRRWGKCLQPVVKVVTSYEPGFYKADYLERVTVAATQVVSANCPNAKVMSLEVSTDILPEDGGAEARVFGGKIVKGRSGWEQSKGTNFALQREQQRLEAERQRLAAEEKARKQAWQSALSDYKRLEERGSIDRIRYATAGGDDFTDIQGAAILSSVADLPISNVFTMVRVSQVDKHQAQADWPYQLTLVDGGYLQGDEEGSASLWVGGFPTETGWYLVKGSLSGYESEDSMHPRAEIKVEESIRCEREECSEFSNSLSAVRKSHNLPEWSPISYAEYKQGKRN